MSQGRTRITSTPNLGVARAVRKPNAFKISKPKLRESDEIMTGRTERKSSKESEPYVDYDTNNTKCGVM
jgi:hypothetical protein